MSLSLFINFWRSTSQFSHTHVSFWSFVNRVVTHSIAVVLWTLWLCQHPLLIKFIFLQLTNTAETWTTSFATIVIMGVWTFHICRVVKNSLIFLPKSFWVNRLRVIIMSLFINSWQWQQLCMFGNLLHIFELIVSNFSLLLFFLSFLA